MGVGGSSRRSFVKRTCVHPVVVGPFGRPTWCHRLTAKNDQEDLDRPGPVAPENLENPCRGVFEDLRSFGRVDVLDDEGVAIQLVELVHGDHFQA